MTHTCAYASNVEVLDVIGQLLEKLAQSAPDADLARILESLPCNCATLTRLLGGLAVRAGALTLEAAGADITSGTVQVEVVGFMPADDIPAFAKTAAELARLGCEFLLAAGAPEELASTALNEAAHAAAHRAPEFAFLVLTELLGRIRRLLRGDTREVITS